MTRSTLAWTLAAGVALGVLMTLTPLTIPVAALTVIVVALARRGLPPDERRWVTTVIVVALAARLLVVLALAVVSMRVHDDQNAGILFGDEAYNLARSIRTRNILLGFPASKLDYIVMFDSYADTWYLSVLAWIQVTFGPSSYAIRLLNGVLFVGGASLLYRLARTGFGVAPALAALTALLFLPSLFLWSISLLKDSAYFVLTASAIVAMVRLVTAASWRARVGWIAVLAATLWAVGGLRPGALLITAGGLLCGLAARWCLRTPRRVLAGALAVTVACIVAARTPAVQARLLDGLAAAAKQHTGHAFTVGHAYKTLDARFYAKLESPSGSVLTLTPPEAARYVMRAAVSFVTVPLPWQVATRSEVVFIPEQLVWYAIVVLAIAGLRAAWARDPLLTAMLAGYVLPMAAVLALTNGNVGTLVRLRGLVTPFMVWIGALGCVVILERVMAGREAIS